MPDIEATERLVVQLATDEEKAWSLLNMLAEFEEAGDIETYGVNTRTDTLELVQHVDLTSIDPDASSRDNRVQTTANAFEAIGVNTRVMLSPPEALIASLTGHIGPPVRDGLYDDDKWCSTALDYCHAVYYLQQEHSDVLGTYQNQCNPDTPS